MPKQFKFHKDYILRELAKLESMNWAADEKVAGSIFPYVVLEAINLLKNSELVENPVDYMADSETIKKTLDEILN